jgi:hypothetical protein
VTTLDPDRLDKAQLEDLRLELGSMSDAALATTYEFYRMACGLRKDVVPRLRCSISGRSGRNADGGWSKVGMKCITHQE